MTENILVVDDEEPIADILRFHLERSGFGVDVAHSATDALRLFAEKSYHFIILDVMLPPIDGFEVLKEIRRHSRVPVLLLTAREDEIDKVVGLEIGADDYMTKPFSARELVARIHAVLRRIQPGDDSNGEEHIAVGSFQINPEAHQAYLGGELLDLTHREFLLLASLARSPGRVFTRDMLLDQVWGNNYRGDHRTVDVTMRRLREKVEKDPGRPQYLMTRRGVGYYFRQKKGI